MSNQEIGKLNVVVNLDSTGFQNGISNLNRQMKVVQSEFQAATARLGEFGSNTDRLRLQADALSKQVDIQKQKVAALEAAYQKSVETKGADAKATQDLAIKLNKAQAELAKMENDLKKTTEELEKQTSVWYKLSQATKDAGEKMKSAGEKLSDIGKSLSTHVTAPLAAVGAGLVKLGSDFDKAYDKIRIGTGATGEALAGLQEVFRNVAKEVPNSFDEISTAIADLNTRLDLTGPDLQNLAVQMLNLSRVTGTDLSSNIESAAQAFRAFNLDTKDYGASLDYVFKVSQSTGIGIDRLLSILKTSSPALQQLGLDFQSAATLVGQLEKAGVNVEQAMTGLNRAIANMAKEGIEDANKAVSELFNRIKNAPNDMEATEMAVEIFGTKAGPTLAKAIREGKMSFDELMNSLKSNSESINKVANETDDWAEKFATLKNQLLLALEPLAGPLFDAINNLVPHIQKLADWIGQLAQKFANLSPQQQEMVLKIALIVAAIGPALTVIGKLISTVGTAAKAFSTISMAIANAGGALALLTSPITLVVGAVLLLAGAAALVIANWSEIKTFFLNLWEEVKKIFISSINAITTFLKEWGPLILAVITGPLGWIVYAVVKYWDDIKQFTIDAWNSVKDTVVGAFQWMYDHNYYFQWLVDTIVEKWNNVVNFTTTIWNNITTFLTGIWEGLKTGVTMVWEAIKTVTDTVWNAIATLLVGLWNRIYNQIVQKWNEIFSFIKSIWDKISAGFEDIVNGAYNWGRNMLMNFINGVKAMWNDFTDMLSRIGQTMASYLGFHSPTEQGPGRYADQWAPNLVKMYAEGIKNTLPVLRKVLNEMASMLTPSGILAGGAIYNTYNQGGNTIIFQINSGWDDIERELIKRGIRF